MGPGFFVKGKIEFGDLATTDSCYSLYQYVSGHITFGVPFWVSVIVQKTVLS